jgi:hypothetical protein
MKIKRINRPAQQGIKQGVKGWQCNIKKKSRFLSIKHQFKQNFYDLFGA